MKKQLYKKYVFSLLTGMAAVVALIIYCNYRIYFYARPFVYDQIDSIPTCPVGLLPGTTPRLNDGRNNLYFDYRITAAADLLKAGKIRYILISGDNHRHNYNEPEEMRKALLQQGIPDSVIFLDYAGLRTLDSVVRAKEIFGQDSLTIISQRFHNERAIFLAGKRGIYANGYNAKDVNLYAGFKTQTRELLARVKVFVDLFTNKQPRHLGEKVSIP